MMLQHMVDLQSMEIKYLKEELLAMKKITFQIQHIRMLELETKMTILEVEKGSLIKANIEMTSILKAKEDEIMTK